MSGRQVVAQPHGLRQVARQRRADQQGQGVEVLRYLPVITCQADPGGFHLSARLCQVEGRGHAHFSGAGDQPQAFLVGLEGVLSQREQFAVRLPGQVGIGDVGHQADLRGAARFLAGEVGLQGLFAEAADAPEKIQLVGAEAGIHAVRAAGARIAGGRQVARHPLAHPVTLHADRGKQVGALNAVLRLVGLDVQRRDTQVAVADQGFLHQPLQRRVAEELPPALLGGGHVGRLRRGVGRPLRVLHRHGRGGLVVLGNQRAAPEHDGGHGQGQQ
jgi:hypothetical protein